MKKAICCIVGAVSMICGSSVISACVDHKLTEDDIPVEIPDKGDDNTEDEDFSEGDPASYSDAIYPMDYVPHEESLAEVRMRDERIRRRVADFWKNLNNSISAQSVEEWILNFGKIATKERSPYLDLTYICIDYNYPQLRKPLVEFIKKDIASQYEEMMRELAKDGKGQLNDLPTTQPAARVLADAFCLKKLGAYDDEMRRFIEEYVIEAHVEGKGAQKYYSGTYHSTGYNKELYAMDVAFWVKMLYAGEPDKYPLAKGSFDCLYYELLNYSYDADNSPHYDANTGFNLLLHWGLLQNDEAGLRNSPHVRRIIDRMSHTIMSSGQCAGWGKNMGKLREGGREYLLDGEMGVTWCLKMGYRLFNDPFYLYVARKYEDFRFNVGCEQWNNDYVDVFPSDINRVDRDAEVPGTDHPASLLTTRISSPLGMGRYNGILLERGEKNPVAVQDKLILSTGHHPGSPYMLMDLSYSQHKASHDHRIGINNFIFNGTHICTYLGRPAEGFRVNRPYLVPRSLTIAKDFPVIDYKENEVEWTSGHTAAFGFDARYTDYTIGRYGVKQLSDNVAYGEVEYTRFQYEGISARRRMLLLNNGILIVYDKLVSAPGPGRDDMAGVLYNVWPAVAKTGPNWVLQDIHKSSLAVQDGRYDLVNQTLYYFPRTKSDNTMALKNDPRRDNAAVSTVLSSQTGLRSGEDADFITLIIPMRRPELVETFVSGISVTREGGIYKVSIPSPSGHPIVTTISDNDMSVVAE